MENDEVVVVGFDSAGFIGAVSRMSKDLAQSTAKQLRSHYPSVKCMSNEEFCRLQDEEREERNKWDMMR